MATTLGRVVKYISLYKPDPTHGCLAVTTTAASGSPESLSFRPVYFNPQHELRSPESASAFFSGVVAGFFGWDPERAARISTDVAMHAFETVASGRWTYGLHISVEIETLGGALGEELPPESGVVEEEELPRKEPGGGGGCGDAACAFCWDELYGVAVGV
ncbi:unnamed protein product [Cuscuta campestris]|uniref:Uncharacterized protein n=1 Tax=Cuscuta campestris TaxID=132261 RepID=A0A484L4T4_9ASTE|nr:unnamed protein product [Cuscuta campestris]